MRKEENKPAEPERKITMGSLFDGIGGFPVAAVRNGIEPVWASEIEAFPIAVTKLRFPETQHVGDITKLDGAKLPPVDIICGGSPCQDLPVAGARDGLAGQRSGLFLEQIRIIREMRDADQMCGRTGNDVRPRFGCRENVPGAYNSSEGEDFRAVLEAFLWVEESRLHIVRTASGRWFRMAIQSALQGMPLTESRKTAAMALALTWV